MIREFGPNEAAFLLKAAQWTVLLSLIAFVGGGLVGFTVAMLRTVRFRPANYVAIGYIQFLQGTPLLAQLFVFYFGFGIFGYDVSAWFAATFALTIYASAFLAEIWRGCIQAIPKTQWEASAALALGFAQQMRHVILPQAVKIAIPPTVGFLVQVVKNTSLTSVIGFIELTRAGQIVNGATFQPFTVYAFVAAVYFGLCFPLSVWSQRLERRLRVARAH
ncbi:MAG: amino acid ABC transporter permease [Candidatus Rokuibacteriota bacterium]